MQDITDIILLTYNRLEYLKQTLSYLFERTRSAYRLHVIDDASGEGNAEYLYGLYRERRLETLLLRGQRLGAMIGENQATWLSFSPIVVLTPDDSLCPDVEPDWLARGLAAMEARPKLGVLSLNINEPQTRRRPYEADDEVTYCKCVGPFAFVRRELLVGRPFAHSRANQSPTFILTRCIWANADGWKVGYLTETFTQHIGRMSVAQGRLLPYRGPFWEPVDGKTLRIEERYIWRPGKGGTGETQG